MISSATIQKLERYGQLGLKRRTVEDFVQSSLKDPKRSNVYALTHLQSWQESYAALCCQDARRDAAVSDSLLYAMSFATALVSHHVHRRLTMPSTPSTAEDVFGDDLASAQSLIAELKNIAVHLAQDAQCLRNSGSNALTQAAAHLFSSVADLTFLVSVLRVVRPVSAGRVAGVDEGMQRCEEASRQTSIELHHSTIALLGAVSRVLRRAMVQYPVESLLLRVRTCAALVRQQIHKAAAQGVNAEATIGQANGAEAGDEAPWRTALAAQPVLYILCDCATLSAVGSSALFEPFSLFQKASLLHALTSENGTAELFAPFAVKLRRLLNHLLAATVCNRATRYVVYYRGDDVKLMQNNIRQAGDYALHTFVTSPPTEDTLVQSLQQLAPRSVTRRRCALLLVQWIVSCGYFFQSFCSDESWTGFAQEQRRRTLIQQSNERRAQRQRGGSAGCRPDMGDRSRQDGSRPDGAKGERDAPMSPSDGGAAAAEETRSVTSRVSGGSAGSVASRASLLSTLSRHSAASYLSFLSVLRPEGDEAATTASHAMHESADGNTNLPLILLEELVLGLQQFMQRLPHALLDGLGLRCLVWQSIGQLLGFVQDSIGGAADEVSSHAAGLATLFDLGQDIRYNHGLGYESLGLLFATVLSPQLEAQVAHRVAARPAAVSGAPGTIAREGDSVVARACIDAALSRCLAAYERVAPQVVDANLPVVVRIAARAALVERAVSDDARGAPSLLANPPSAFLRFLVNMVTRLGRNNQLTLLLDALAAHRIGPAQQGDKDATTTTTAVDDEDDVTALQLTFAHPAVRAALMAASGLCLDPEQLLGRLIEYIAVCAGAGLGTTEPVARRPADVLLLLQLVATLLEGLEPTAASSSAILERSTELELQLGAFLLHMDGTGARSGEAGDIAGVERATEDGATLTLRPKARRQLWLHGLFAVYQARAVTVACLRDLGTQHVEAYVEMLEQTLWQVQTHAGSLLASLTASQLRERMSATTHMVQAPYVHVQCLIPQLALQRLALARLVSTLLGLNAGPAEETRQLADVVLDCFIAYEELPAGAPHARLASLANAVTEEEWASLVCYGKPRRVRRALRALLLLSFAADGGTTLAAPGSPVWLRRCLRCAPGALLRAVTDLLNTLEVDDVMSATASNSSIVTPMVVGEATDGEASRTRGVYLVGLLDALQHIYGTLGHLPLWTVLLRRAISWLRSSAQHGVAEHVLDGRLVGFIEHCLLCESRSQDILRRALLATAGQPVRATSAETRHASKARECALAYLTAIDVPPTRVAMPEQDGVTDAVGAEVATARTVDELVIDDTLTALCGMLFEAEMVTLLTTTTQAEVAGHAMSVLAYLYHTAFSALTAARGRGGGDTACGDAERFLRQVAARFRQLCDFHDGVRDAPRLLLKFLTSLRCPLVPPTADGPAAQMSLYVSWQGVLHDYAAQLLHLGDDANGTDGVTIAAVRCFNALCFRLSAIGGGSLGQAATHKRPRSSDASTAANEVSEAESVPISVPDFCVGVEEDVVLGTLSASAPPKSRAALVRAVRFVVALLACGRAAGLTSLWLLYAQRAQTQQGVHERNGRRGGSGGKTRQGHTTPVLLSAVLVHGGGRWYDTVPSDSESAPAGLRGVAVGMAQALWPDGATRPEGLEQRVSHDLGGLYSVSFLRDNLIALVEALRLLRGSAVPGFLYAHLHVMLHAAIKTPREGVAACDAVAVGAVGEGVVESAVERYKLLTVVADTMLQLSALPGFRFALLSTHVRRLLVAGAMPEMRAVHARQRTDDRPGATLWCNLLALCGVAVSVLSEDELFLDEMWLFVHEGVTAASEEALPTQAEATATLALFARSWLFLPHHAEAPVWRRAALLPGTLGALFRCILRGVETGRYERQVLNQLSSFLYQLVKQAEASARAPRDDGVDGGDEHAAGRSSHERRGKSARVEFAHREASDPVRRMTLTAVLTTLFELAQHHVATFTAYSNDLDFVAADLLKALGHHHLPRNRAPPIAAHDDAHVRAAGASDTTLSDLAFTCVGDEDSKALLRQAALRIEEEEDQQGQLVGERRHIFRVD